RLRRLLRRTQYALYLERIVEIRVERLARGCGAKKVGQRAGEGMFVANGMARLPVIVRNQQAARAFLLARSGGIEEFQVVQMLEIKPQHALRSVNRVRVAIATADRIARGFECPHRA